jgi:hypothetical protein
MRNDYVQAVEVPALLVFYSSFGSQNTVWCKIQYIQNATDCVEIKIGKSVFSYTIHAQIRLFAVLLPLALSIFPSPLSVT